MLIDSETLADGTVVESEVCVVGAGAAGIALARALAGHAIDVCVVESGGLDRELETDRLTQGVTVGEPYPLAGSRVRQLGGSTSHWGGLCGTLEASDFTARPWIPYSGWPIDLAELEPWYDRALPILDLTRRYRFAELERDRELYPRLLGADDTSFEPILRLQSPPTRMGVKYRDEIASSARIRCHLHANAVELVPDAEGRSVLHLATATLGGRRHRFRARQFVLCAGGIENARLLLLSDSVVRGGLGNEHDVVGRFFMDHFNLYGGDLVAAPPAGARGFQEIYLYRKLGPGLPGVSPWVSVASTPGARERWRSLGYSANFLLSHKPEHVAADVAELFTNPAGDGAPRPAHPYALFVFAEQSPNPASRVRLAPEKDALGCRKVAVEWRSLPEDRRSVERSTEQLAIDVARAGHGRVRLNRPAGSLLGGGGHHLGTTRMADDPKRGVTDRHGRVHGVANLHVAGGSLFPTGGFMSPTLTIVALALRLGDRLRTVLAEPAAQTKARTG